MGTTDATDPLVSRRLSPMYFVVMSCWEALQPLLASAMRLGAMDDHSTRAQGAHINPETR